MGFGTILNTIFIGPLKLVFEILFSIAYTVTGNVGISIVLLSLAINVLVLPLYRCADAMQEKAQKREAELHDGIAHIKKTFSGSEKMMMLDTFYKQNNYSPFSALSGVVSLVLEIPFFMAAYQFLSSAAHLQGISLGPIVNLAQPDALINIGGFSINVLPFIMTIVNIIASVIFLKGAPLKSKIQLYAMAAVFLVLLYSSPSGLVFYWTLNNVFSLIKNILYKLKHPKRIIVYICSIAGILLFALTMIFFNSNKIFVLVSEVFMILLQVPIALYYIKQYCRKKNIKFRKKEVDYKPNKKIFIICATFLSILTGLFIPSIFIADNPAEFVDMYYYLHPNWYLAASFCLSAGTFLVWFSVFYWLAPPKGRVYFERAMVVLCVIMTINYFCFGNDLGNISSSLQYDNTMWFSVAEYIINAFVIVVLAVGLLYVAKRFKKITSVAMAIATFAIGVTSVVNFMKISSDTPSYDASAVVDSDISQYSMELTSEGQNVIVIMLDRALGATYPFIQREMQMRATNGIEGADDFLTGFTYYSNVISYGNHTNFASPALLGGYEYTPIEINLRENDTMAQKLNEANLLLPRIFTEQNTASGQPFANKASIFDPVYTNNAWISDLSVYEDTNYNPNYNADGENAIVAKNTIGTILDNNQRKATVENRKRDFFVFSVMKGMPLPVQLLIYFEGQYNRVATIEDKFVYSTQVVQDDNVSHASGISRKFMENYNIISQLDKMTTLNNDGNKFVFFRNDVTHEPMVLHEDTYEPIVYETVTLEDGTTEEVQVMTFDNTEYDAKYASRFDPVTTASGKTYSLNINNGTQMAHYQTNLMALLRLEEWFDYLKANNMYDNSRIIIVSDHGFYLDQVDELSNDGLSYKDESSVESYFPLLLVKDFGETGSPKEDGTFMTNADVPTIALNGIVSNPINPFTNKVVSSIEKTSHDQFIIKSKNWNPNNNGDTFSSPSWIRVNNSLWDCENWELYDNKTVLEIYEAIKKS